jgi:hypothetical protein
MADVTNAGTPAPGGQLGGEASRQAAIKRLQKQQAFQPKTQQTSGPNTGGSGLPKPERTMTQAPGQMAYSATPGKAKRI